MSEMTLDKRIINYRKQNRLTQSELGKLLNVSPQAVSRWEHGGMPDAALIPKLAEMLDCSLDDLYAVATTKAQTIEDLLAREFQEIPEEDRMKRAVQLAWNIAKVSGCAAFGDAMSSVLAQITANEDADQNDFAETINSPTRCYFYFEDGLTCASISSKFKYVLLMQEPEDGYNSILNCTNDYQRLFSILSREHRLAVYLLGLTLQDNQQYTVDYVRAKLGLSQEQAQEVLDDLCDSSLLLHSGVQVYDRCVDCYSMSKTSAVIPFLYFATTIMWDNKTHNMHINGRDKPMLRTPLLEEGGALPWNPVNSKARKQRAKLNRMAGP